MIALFGIATPVPARVFDSDLPFEITAREISWDGERNLVVATGQVRIAQTVGSIEADWLAYNRQTRQGAASGNVVIVEGDEILRAAFVEFAVDTTRGFVLEGHYDTGPGGFIVSASQLTRTGPVTYDVSDATFTTCRCPKADDRNPWQIEAEETDLEIGGYAYSKNAKLDVLEVPVLWLPRLIFPVKTDRETGLLFPELELGSRNGFGGGLPFFWAPRRDLGVIVTPRYLSKRVFKGDLEVERVSGTRSYTDLFASYVRDKDVPDFNGEPPYSKNRWAVKFREDHDLPLGLRSVSDVNVVSDNDYVIDFNEMRRHRTARFLQSFGHVGRAFGDEGRVKALTGFAFAQDLQNTDPIDRDEYLLQRLPDLSLSSLTGSLGPLDRLTFALDADYSYFTWRENPFRNVDVARSDTTQVIDGQFIDIGIGAIPVNEPFTTPPGELGKGNGRFDEGEPLADRGHRVVLHPRLGLPLRFFDGIDFFAEAGYQQILYDAQYEGYAERGSITGRADLSTRLVGWLDLPLLPRLEHTVEPRVSWAYLRPDGQNQNPLFVPKTAVPQTRVRQLSLENVVLDQADRVERTNRVRVSFANSFYREAEPGEPSHLWADFTLSGEYDFAQDQWGTVVLDGHAYPTFGPHTRFIFGYDVHSTRIDEMMLDVTTPLPYRAALSTRYRYVRRIPRFFERFRSEEDFDNFDGDFMRINQFDVGLRMPLAEVAKSIPWLSRFTLIYALSYSFEEDLTIGNRGGVEYTSKCKCWAIGIDLREDRVRGVEVDFRYTLLGLGDDQLSGSILEEGIGGLLGGN